MANLDVCDPSRTRNLRPPGTLCDFYLRTPAGDDPAGPYRYRHLRPESYGGRGSLDLPSPPGVGDTIYLTETLPDGAQGTFTVVARDWFPPHYGSPAWPYGTPRPEDGARLTVMVEAREPGPFVNEAADDRSDEQREADDEHERTAAAACAELVAEAMYPAYQRIVGDDGPRYWRDLTESPEIAHATRRLAWREAAAAACTAILGARPDPGPRGTPGADHDTTDDGAASADLDRTIMRTVEAAAAAGLFTDAGRLANLAESIRDTWRGARHHDEGLISAAMHLADYLISLANALRDLQVRIMPGVAAAVGIDVTPPGDPHGGITPRHGRPS